MCQTTITWSQISKFFTAIAREIELTLKALLQSTRPEITCKNSFIPILPNRESNPRPPHEVSEVLAARPPGSSKSNEN